MLRSPTHLVLRSCMLEDFSLSDKSELFPLKPVNGSSTFSSSTSCRIGFIFCHLLTASSRSRRLSTFLQDHRSVEWQLGNIQARV